MRRRTLYLSISATLSVAVAATACAPLFSPGEPQNRVDSPVVELGEALASRSKTQRHDRTPPRVDIAPPPRASSDEEDSDAGAMTVAVVSDMNGGYGSTSYTREVRRTVDWLTEDLEPDLVVSTGDHVAGQKRGLDYASMWDAFHETVTEPLKEAGIPFAPTPGNHDASAAPRYRRERQRFRREWRARRPSVEFVDQAHFPLRYAFEVGPALFVSIDATMPGRLPDRQFRWLEGVLSESDHRVKIVYGHLPLVPFAEGRESEILGSRRLEQLLRAEEVDMMLSGHHHAYYPGRRGSLRLVGMACLGGGARDLLGTDRRSRHSAVVLRVSRDGEIDVEAHYGEEMHKTVDREALPESLGDGRWRIWREDVGITSRRPGDRVAAAVTL